MRFITLGVLAATLMATTLYGEPQRMVVTINATDGVALTGTYFSPARRGPAILLLHQCNMDRRAWEDLAGDLVGIGIHVLTIDFRGFGESGGPRVPFAELRKTVIPEKWPDDVETAYAFLRGRPDVDKTRIAIGGASCGVTQSSDLVTHHPEVRTVMFLSGVASDAGLHYIAQTPTLAVFGAASEDDKAAAAGITAVLHASTNPKSTFKIYSGTEHGVPMFARNPELKPLVVTWLKSRLLDRSQTH
jgi:dienelactone hydrolase